MAVAISAMVLSAWATEGTLDAAGLGTFGAAAAVSLYLMVQMYRGIEPTAPAPVRHGIGAAGATVGPAPQPPAEPSRPAEERGGQHANPHRS